MFHFSRLMAITIALHILRSIKVACKALKSIHLYRIKLCFIQFFIDLQKMAKLVTTWHFAAFCYNISQIVQINEKRDSSNVIKWKVYPLVLKFFKSKSFSFKESHTIYKFTRIASSQVHSSNFRIKCYKISRFSQGIDRYWSLNSNQ